MANNKLTTKAAAGIAKGLSSNNDIDKIAAAAGAAKGLSNAGPTAEQLAEAMREYAASYRKPSNSNTNSNSNPNPSVYPTGEQVQSAMREYAVLKNQPKYDFQPSEYQLKYGETIENLLKQLNDRANAGFSYDPAADSNLQEYFRQYDLQADAAIDKSIGTYAPAGGGMSSTALALANEAAAAYEAKKNALVPEFYNAAYNQYLNQNSSLADLANSYLALENNNYNIWAANQEQRQNAALQKYEQDYVKWLKDLDSIGYTVDELGQVVEKENASTSNPYNMLIGALGATTGAIPLRTQNSSQLQKDDIIDQMLDSIYSGTDVESFKKTLNKDETTKLGYLNSLVSTAQKYDNSDVYSSFNREQHSLGNVGSGLFGYAIPAIEGIYDGVGALLNTGMLTAKYTKNDFKNYFIVNGYSESKAEEMAGNVSKRYQEIDKNRSQYGTQYTADAIALAIKEELEKNQL